MIIYKKGDLLQAKESIIAHGCNCVGGFGSGVAGQIAKKWPEVRRAYLRQHSLGWKLGFVQFVDLGDKIIANCGTQYEYMPRGIRHADYDAIRSAMRYLKGYASGLNLSVAIPKIGAGLAGGDWSIIEQIIEEEFNDYCISVYEI